MSENKALIEDEISSLSFSLLYPPGVFVYPKNLFFELAPAARHDLGVDQIVAAFTADQEHQKEIQKIFSLLIRDPDVITYRQDVIDDLIRNPTLVDRLASLLPVIDSLVRYSYRAKEEMNSLHEVIWRMGELQNILNCIQGLGEIFLSMEGKINSQGLRILQEEVHKVQKDPTYRSLAKELPELLSKLRACNSITIGVNLDASLRPVQAVLLSVNDDPYTDQSLLNKLFGLRKDQEGIAPLHSVPQRTVGGSVDIPIISDLGWAVEPMMVPLFADLAKVLQKTTAPIAKQLGQYAEVKSRLFINLRQDLIFYLGAVRFIQRMQDQGLAMCRPRIASSSDRLCEVKESYNVNLALHYSITAIEQNPPAVITTNDINLCPEGQILILTGPNQGGKTTYMQEVGSSRY